MITALFLAAALAGNPAAATTSATEPGPPSTSPLDEKISLTLKDASIRDLLEKVAVLLDATPILKPGVEGTITLDVKEISVRDLLAKIEAVGGVKTELRNGRLIVFPLTPRPAGVAPAPVPAPREGKVSTLFELRSAGRQAVIVALGPALVALPVAGCAEPLRVALLRGDDGGRLVFPDGRGRARILAPGAGEVRVAGCADPITVERADDASVPAPAPAASVGELVTLRIEVLEVGRDTEDVLTAPAIQTVVGKGFAIRSGYSSRKGEGVDREIDIRGLVVESSESDALLALSATVTPDPTTSDQTLRLPFDKTERVTLSSTFGDGRSALVAELTLLRAPKRREASQRPK